MEKNLKKQKFQKPNRLNILNGSFDNDTGLWWGFYKRNSPLFLHRIELFNGDIIVRAGKVYNPIYSDGSTRLFLDTMLENGELPSWVERYNAVFDTAFTSMKEVKIDVENRGGEWTEFFWWYVVKFLPEIKSYSIIDHPDFPIRRRKGKRMFHK